MPVIPKKPPKPERPRQTRGASFIALQLLDLSAGMGIDLDLVLDDYFYLGGGWGYNPYEESGMPNLHVFLGKRRPVYLETGAMWFCEGGELDTEGLYYIGTGRHHQKIRRSFRFKIGGMLILEAFAGDLYPWGGLSLGYNL